MHGRTAYPNRKISETVLNFAAPVLDDLPSEAPEHRAREALQVCFTAWNAIAHPFIGSRESVFRISRSSVPWTR